jgi:phosphoglycolate phosphatase
MSRPTIAGILFDKDGTLFDFQKTWGKVVEQALDRLAPDRETWIRMADAGGYDSARGCFLPGSAVVASATSEIGELWATLLPSLGAREIERVLDDAALEALASPESLFPAVPDLPALLASLRSAGYVLGVATHDSERAARLQLGVAGVLDAFAFIAGYDSGHGLKPGPGMLLAFSAATGIAPASVVMVGDSRHDLEVARSARAAMAVGVLTGPATHDDLAPHADHVLPSIGDLPALLTRFHA